MKIFLISSLLIFSIYAEESCPKAQRFQNVDLRGTLPPLRNQDSIGWCASFGSADLLTQWMDRNKDRLGMNNVDFTLRENMVSAAATALTYNKSGRRGNARISLYEDELGRANLIIEVSTLKTRQRELKKEFVKTGQSPTENAEYQDNRETWKHLQSIIDGIPTFEEPESGMITKVIKSLQSNQIFFEQDIPSDSYELSNIKDSLAALYNLYSPRDVCLSVDICQAAKLMQQTFPSQSLLEIEEIISRGFDQGEDSLANLLSSNTGGFTIDSEIFPTVEVLGGGSKSGRSRLDMIHKKLLQGKLVGITYGASILLPEPVPRDSHVSTLAGVFYDCSRNEPVYILRNSWGEQSCDANYEIILADKMKEMPEKKAKEVMPFECDNGYYLVPQSSCGGYIHTLYTLE